MDAQEEAGDWKQEAIERRRAIIAKLRATIDLPTPWEQLPQIPCGSIGWRMGEGEDVMDDWYLWIQALTLEQFSEYRCRHTPPPTWADWFERVSTRLTNEPARMAWDAYWDLQMREYEARINQR